MRTEIKVNWQILALSFALAAGLWYVVTVRDRLEVQAEVSLHYRGMPENLMVRDGLLKSFTVQLRGPKEMVKCLDTKMLSYSVDLSDLHRGTNLIPLAAPYTLVNSRALDVMGFSPGHLSLEVESVLERTVPLDLRFTLPALAQALKAENLRAAPPTVTVRGPESEVRKLTSLPLEVPIDPDATENEYERSLSVGTHAQVTVSPGTVRVYYSMAGKRSVINVERTPLANIKNRQRFKIVPAKVALTVELPESLAANKSYLDKIQGLVIVHSVTATSSLKIKPVVELPEGARLVSINPTELTVTNTGK